MVKSISTRSLGSLLMPATVRMRVWLVVTSVVLAGCGLPPPVRTAQSLLQQGDYAGAEGAAEQALQTHPDHPVLWRVKIQAAFNRGDAARALAVYRQWHQHSGRHDRILLRRLAMTTMWQGLRVPSAQVRARTIQGIERLELEPLAIDVAARLADDADLVAAAAAVALLRSHPDAPRVATQLLGSEDAATRALVVAGIGRKVKAAARSELVPALGDPHPAVRRAAIAAIAALGELADGARLAELARSDQHKSVRAAALRALARAQYPDAHTAALRALDDSHLGARLAAVGILRRHGDRSTLRRLAAAADVPVALRAAMALDDAALLGNVVQQALADSAQPVRQAGLNAVHRVMPRAHAIALATGQLDSPSWPVRIAAARALLYLGARAQATAVLEAALGAPDGRVRLNAAAALTRLNDPRGLTALTALADHPDPTIRQAMVRAHGQLPRDQALTPALAGALADESPLVRIAAAETVLSLLAD